MGEFYSFPRAKEDALFYSETLYFEEVGEEIRKMAAWGCPGTSTGRRP
jgi:hypothetical protein